MESEMGPSSTLYVCWPACTKLLVEMGSQAVGRDRLNCGPPGWHSQGSFRHP